MPISRPSVRLARPADLDAIAGILGRAFEDDPVWRFAISPRDRFAERIGRIMGIVARVHLEDEGTVWVDDDRSAAAVWASPGHWSVPPWRFARHLVPLVRSAGPRLGPGLRLLAEMERRHPPEPPHWYLAVLGTEPAAQGRGLGSALLAPVLERCDRDLVGAYLESSKERNVPFYERHGFRVLETVEAGRGAPPIFTMWRDPHPVD